MPKPAATMEPDQAASCCPSGLSSPLGAVEASALATAFAALADPVRLRIVSILAAADQGEVCICELVEPLGKSQPTVSHHMKILGDVGLVHGRRRGKWVWYALDRERLEAIRTSLDLDGI